MTTPLERYEYYAVRTDRIDAARARRTWVNLVVLLTLALIPLASLWFVSSSQPLSPEETLAIEKSVYYPNCAAARAAGKAPIFEGQPGYRSELDRNGDGIACEPFNPH